MRLRLSILIGILFVFGFLLFKAESHSEFLKGPLPTNLLVASQNGLINFTYDQSKKIYVKKSEVYLFDVFDKITGKDTYPEQIVTCNNYIFVRLQNKILRIDYKFKNPVSKKFGSTGALATDGKNIFVSADNFFIALDLDLKELSRVDIDKNAHNILIYKNTAYLLDNIVTPVYLFRIDLSRLKNIQITDRFELHGIYAHLDGQWINPELGQWLVIQSYSHQGGCGQIVHIYSIDKSKDRIAPQEIFSYSIAGLMKGFRIVNETPLPPIWAVLQDKGGKFHLAKIDSKNNKVSFSKIFQLDGFQDSLYTTGANKQKDDFLFITSGDLLKVFDMKKQPKLILSQDLREFDVTGTTDILPY